MTLTERIRAELAHVIIRNDLSIAEVAASLGYHRHTVERFLDGKPATSDLLDAIDAYIRRAPFERRREAS